MAGRVDERLTTAALADAANASERRLEREPEPAEAPGRQRPAGEYSGPLVPDDFAGRMRSQWENIQTSFVDDPRTAVQNADELVANAIKKLAETFAAERARLEEQWSRGAEASTEDLRQALQRYRAFFQRLLSL